MNHDGKFQLSSITRVTRINDRLAQALRAVDDTRQCVEIRVLSGEAELLAALAPDPDDQTRLIRRLLIAETEARLLAGAKDLAMMLEHNVKQ